MFSNTVPISSSTLPAFDSVVDKYRDIFQTGMITNWKYVREYEERAAEYLQVPHVVAVANASAGLMLMAKCLELQGKVILPSFTFSMTGHALEWNGLEPVYVDIDPETCLIDPKQVEKAITPDTSAILGVHIWGNPCPGDQLQQIADKHGLTLLFDAAQAFGSRYLESPVGGMGVAEVFSCSPTKVVTSGEGGLVSINDGALAEKLRTARNYGDDGSYDCEFAGFNARMSELHGVLGLASMEMVKENIEHRLHLIDMYRSYLGQLPGIRFQETTPGGVTNGVYFSIFVDTDRFGLNRDQLYQALKQEHVDTRRYYYPSLHQQAAYSRYTSAYAGSLPNTDLVSQSALALPIFSHMTEAQVETMCQAIERLYVHREQIVKTWTETNGSGH